MNQPIKQTYQGIDIAYDEKCNVWVYELRGRERSSESLIKAKETIDKPEPKEKKPFERVNCWRSNWNRQFELVEVTSIADSPAWQSSEHVWISYLDGKSKRREKVSADNVFPQTPSNNELIARCKELDSQIEKLNEELTQTKRKLRPLTLPKREAE